MIFNFKTESKEFDSSSPFNKRLRKRAGGWGKQKTSESFEEHIKNLRMKPDSFPQDASLNSQPSEDTEPEEA